jgi:hypothetical protein
MAGYSGTPLVKKLGVKADHKVALIDAPPDFESTLDDLPPDVAVARDLGSHVSFDVLVCFVVEARRLRSRFRSWARKLVANGGLWIAWPKKASGVATDLTENVVREIGLEAGLVDNKVCAIDDTWSGLRFVIRLADRPRKS